MIVDLFSSDHRLFYLEYFNILVPSWELVSRAFQESTPANFYNNDVAKKIDYEYSIPHGNFPVILQFEELGNDDEQFYIIGYLSRHENKPMGWKISRCRIVTG